MDTEKNKSKYFLVYAYKSALSRTETIGAKQNKDLEKGWVTAIENDISESTSVYYFYHFIKTLEKRALQSRS